MDIVPLILYFGAIALGLGVLIWAVIRTQQRSPENDSSAPRKANPIATEDLTLEMIPLPDADWPTIARFAATFNGYEFWGSFERCAAIANANLDRDVSDLRTCLFFEQRRCVHIGTDPDAQPMEYLRQILVKLRNGVAIRVLR